MTTSVAKHLNKTRCISSRRAGMTLLEVVIALSLVALIVGIGVIKYADGAEERTIRNGAMKIEAMASRGHAMAILHQKPFWLRFEPGRVILAGADLKEGREEEEEFKWEVEEEDAPAEVIYDEFDTEALVLLQRWGAAKDDWQEPGEDNVVTWNFQSTGLCEPVGIRVEFEDSWIMMFMHPLTARVEDEERMIK